MGPVENGGWTVIRRVVGEQCAIIIYTRSVKIQAETGAKLTQASLVVHIWVSKVEVSMSFPVIELDCDCMVCFLIHRPDSSSEVEA